METRPSPTKSWGPLWGHWVRTPRSRNYRKWYRKSMLTVKITHLLEWYWCLGNGKVFYHYAFSKRVFCSYTCLLCLACIFLEVLRQFLRANMQYYEKIVVLSAYFSNIQNHLKFVQNNFTYIHSRWIQVSRVLVNACSLSR